MDLAILIIILITFTGSLALLPILLIKLMASRNSATISLGEALKFYFRKSGKKPLFKAIAITQRHGLPVTTKQLETHLLAGGDPHKVVAALSENLNNAEVNFQMLSAIDLSGKDVGQALKQANEIHTFKLIDFPINSFKLDYEAKYKRGFYGIWVDEEDSEIKDKVSNKLRAFASSWDSKDPITTQNFLRTNLFNSEYWENVLKAQLIEQSINVKL